MKDYPLDMRDIKIDELFGKNINDFEKNLCCKRYITDFKLRIKLLIIKKELTPFLTN